MEKGPLITPHTAQVLGETVEVFAHNDPAKYPGGLEIVVFPVGGLEPIGRRFLPPNQLAAILPPGMSLQLLKVLHAAQQKVLDETKRRGGVRTPGLDS